VWTTTAAGPRVKVAEDTQSVSFPSWSPDGKWLAVEITRGDSTHVGVLPSAGGAIEQLTSEPGHSWPSWGPDNDRLVFAGERDGVWNLYTVSRRTRAVTRLTSFASGAAYILDPVWSPSGSRIVFEWGTPSATIWTMRLAP
jgi:TolB protein